MSTPDCEEAAVSPPRIGGSFVVRLETDADGSWRGQVEHVRSAERAPLHGPSDLIDFIQAHLRPAPDPSHV